MAEGEGQAGCGSNAFGWLPDPGAALLAGLLSAEQLPPFQPARTNPTGQAERLAWAGERQSWAFRVQAAMSKG